MEETEYKKLLDHFAGLAMVGILSNRVNYGGHESQEEVAEVAYQQAVVMINRRDHFLTECLMPGQPIAERVREAQEAALRLFPDKTPKAQPKPVELGDPFVHNYPPNQRPRKG